MSGRFYGEYQEDLVAARFEPARAADEVDDKNEVGEGELDGVDVASAHRHKDDYRYEKHPSFFDDAASASARDGDGTDVESVEEEERGEGEKGL